MSTAAAAVHAARARRGVHAATTVDRATLEAAAIGRKALACKFIRVLPSDMQHWLTAWILCSRRAL